MLRFGPMRLFVLPLVAPSVPYFAGCAGTVPATGAPKNPMVASGPVRAAAVDEHSFGSATYKLLLER